MSDNYVHYEETFDDYYAIINGYSGYRLTIFKEYNNYSYIVYQNDSRRIKKLINEISDFRYDFIKANIGK